MSKTFLVQWGHMQRKLAGLPVGVRESSTAWQPNADVYDGPGGLVVKVELAGVPCDSIRVLLEEGALVIQGARRDPYARDTAQGYRFRQMELEYGPFQRAIPLPYPVDGAAAQARCVDGILEVRLPRAASAIRKRVTIVLSS